MSAPADTKQVPASRRRAWWACLGLALIARLYVVGTEATHLHPDAEFQALEPAYELIWGGGILPWEFREGLRSWAWPGLLALPMAITRGLGLAGPGLGMEPAILSVRLACVVIDLAGLWAFWRLLGRHTALPVQLIFAGLYALHPAFVWPGTEPLIDLPCQVLWLWVIERGALTQADSAANPPSSWPPTRAYTFGALSAACVALRPQLWPAMGVVGLVFARQSLAGAEPRKNLGRVALAGGLVLLAFGALDWLTWGAPFSSTVTYLRFNLQEGLRSFGTMPPDRYWEHAEAALPALRIPLVLLAVVGAWSAPGLSLVLLAFLLPHQWIDYRVWRFIQPALVPLLLLAALGLQGLSSRAGEAIRRILPIALGLLFAASTSAAFVSSSLWRTTWLHNLGGPTAVETSRGLHRAFLELSRHPAPTVVVNGVMPRDAAPGRVYLGHATPLLHPASGDPAPVEGVHIVPAAARDAAQAAGWTLRWADAASGVTIVEAPR